MWVSRVPAPIISTDPFREGAGKDLLEDEEIAERKRWASLSTRDKISDWSLKHQYSMILGSWAATLGLAATIIMRDKNQTTAQKVRNDLHILSTGDFDWCL